MSLADLLLAGPWAPDDVVVHAGARQVSRAALETTAVAVADALADLGVQPGAPVAVMLPDVADLVATLFGVWKAGGVYVPMNPRLTDTEVDRIAGSVAPVAVVTTSDRAPRFGDRPLITLDDGRLDTRRGIPAGAGAVRYDPGVALVQFTSGTTGAPKAVLLTHDGVQSLIDGVLAKLRSGAPEDAAGPRAAKPHRAPMPNLIPVSLSLWAGIYNVLFAFSTGAPVVLMDGFDPLTFRDLVQQHGIRSSVLPPAAIAMLADDERIEGLAPLRFVRSITAPLSPLQARRFRDRFGIAVLNGWGQTEIGGEVVGWNAADSREYGDTKLGSVGRPHQGVELRTVDGDGNPVPAGDAGELWVRTPARAAGYADGTDLSDRISADGFFRTGDIGRIDDDGFVWIDGRVSDMINRGGLKVHPGEIEEVLRLAPQVIDAAVVAAPDERLGEVPVAFVVAVKDGPAPDASHLDALCRAHLAPYKVPVRFTVVEALPRNEVGKVLKHALPATP